MIGESALAIVESSKCRHITVYCKPKHRRNNQPPLTRKPSIGGLHTQQMHVLFWQASDMKIGGSTCMEICWKLCPWFRIVIRSRLIRYIQGLT